MEDSRDLKTLLELLLEEVKSSEYELCSSRASLWRKELITSLENGLLQNFIPTIRPKWYQYGYSFKQRNSAYWWEIGKVEPRVKFLQHWIKKLS